MARTFPFSKSCASMMCNPFSFGAGNNTGVTAGSVATASVRSEGCSCGNTAIFTLRLAEVLPKPFHRTCACTGSPGK